VQCLRVGIVCLMEKFTRLHTQQRIFLPMGYCSNSLLQQAALEFCIFIYYNSQSRVKLLAHFWFVG
jgi:hypothetical protein